MKLTTYQKAAAWAVIQALFAGCSAGDQGNADGTSGTSGTSTPSPSPTKATIPTITSQPANASVAAGATATFTVAASGTSPFYQWYLNGKPIAGATSASYTTPALTAANNGDRYTVSAYNSAGNAIEAFGIYGLAAAVLAIVGGFALHRRARRHERELLEADAGTEAGRSDGPAEPVEASEPNS